jgi:hypothetical protein
VLGGPENDADTLRALYICTGLPLKAAGVTVIRLDHAGKNLELGQRGTSAKNDDVDLVWQLTVQDDGLKLKATHRRQSWIPEEIDLTILEDPLRYEQAQATWPVGTKDAATALEKLGLPLTVSNRDARKALQEAGYKIRAAITGAAIKYRRYVAGGVTGNAGNAEMPVTRISGDSGKLDSGDTRVTPVTESTANGVKGPPIVDRGPLPSPEPLGDIKKHRIFDKDEDWE